MYKTTKEARLKFSHFFISGENSVVLSSAFFTIGHGDKVTVDMENAKGVIIPGGMIKCV